MAYVGTRDEGESILIMSSDGIIKVSNNGRCKGKNKIGVNAPQQVRVLREEAVTQDDAEGMVRRLRSFSGAYTTASQQLRKEIPESNVILDKMDDLIQQLLA